MWGHRRGHLPDSPGPRRDPSVWLVEQQGGGVGGPEGRSAGSAETSSPPSPAPTPPHPPQTGFLPVICALGKHGWFPGSDASYLGSCETAAARERLGLTGWEEVGGRVPTSSVLPTRALWAATPAWKRGGDDGRVPQGRVSSQRMGLGQWVSGLEKEGLGCSGM